MTCENINIQFISKPTVHNFIDLENQVFGRLTVIGYAGRSGKPEIPYWFCRCECGNIIAVRGVCLRENMTKSCGCLRQDKAKRITHGESRRRQISLEFHAFYQAKARCNNANCEQFKNYGGRGIEFRFNSFEEFLAEVGRKPTAKHSLNRIDVNGNYEIGNIEWATMKEQQRNRRNNLLIEINGKTKTLVEWCEFYKQPYPRAYKRISSGWCLNCIFTLPNHSFCSHR